MGLRQLWPSTGTAETQALTLSFLTRFCSFTPWTAPPPPPKLAKSFCKVQRCDTSIGSCKLAAAKIGRSASSSPPLPPRRGARPLPPLLGLSASLRAPGAGSARKTRPAKKANRILVTPASRAQESAERRAPPSPSKAGFGRGTGRWEGGTGRWCHFLVATAQPWPPTTPLHQWWKWCTRWEYFYSTFKRWQPRKKTIWMEIFLSWRI